jgi:hypothetical protein
MLPPELVIVALSLVFNVKIKAIIAQFVKSIKFFIKINV